MSDDLSRDDSREVQSKSDRPAASTGRMPRPVGPTTRGPTEPPPSEVASSAAPSAAVLASSAAAPSSAVAASSAAAPSSAVAPSPVAGRAADPDDMDDIDDADHVDGEEAEDLPLTFAERLRRVPPAPVILTAGSLGSLLFLARAVTSHTTPVPVLMSAAVVAGMIFGLDAVVASVATWRAGRNGESGWALVLALIGGVATLISAGAFAGMLVMILVLNS